MSRLSSQKQELLLTNLRRFYSEKAHMDKLLPILTGASPISLRLVDWFVTNYARNNQTIYLLHREEPQPNELPTYFLVFPHYKSQLKAFSKKQFDPFCRRERIQFCYDGIHVLETTLGQLNFFRWAILYGVLDYIEGHLELIEKDMNEKLRSGGSSGTQSKKTSKKTGAVGGTLPPAATVNSDGSKRTRRSRTTSRSIVHRHQVPITVCFDRC